MQRHRDARLQVITLKAICVYVIIPRCSSVAGLRRSYIRLKMALACTVWFAITLNLSPKRLF